MVTLAGALAADLLAAFVHEDGAPRSVLLWLDPDGQFTRLRDAVGGELAAREVTLLALDPGGSQFELKLALLDLEADGGRAVVHLPGRSVSDLDPAPDGRPPALWAFVEYRYKGALWGHVPGSREVDPPTLDEWLLRRDVRFSGGGARAAVKAGGPDSRLARYAAKHAHSELGQFPQPVNSATLNVVGEPRDLAIDLLLDPEGAVARWDDARADAVEHIGASFGVDLAGDAPQAWAEQLAVHLAIVEAWDAFGRATDFPFLARIPADEKPREAALALVRNAVLPRPDVADRLRTLVNRHAAELAGLVAWSGGRSGVPAAIPAIAQARLREIVAAVEAASGAGAAAGVKALDELLPGHDAAAAADRGFKILRDVRDLAHLADRLRGVLVAAASTGAMARTYATEAWRVDDAYLRIAAACREHAAMAPVRRLAERVYAGYLDAVNQRFTDLVEAAASWVVEGLRPVTDIADELWSAPLTARSRRAVIAVDALRLDIAQRLVERLPSAELHPVVTTLPTTTPFGMTALLPRDREPISVAAGKDTVSLAIGASTGLDGRAGRIAHLQRVLGSRGDSVAFVELEAMLHGETIPDARFVVVFNYELDDRGHSAAGTAALPDDAGRLPGRLAGVIERFHASGIGEVHVVTDHGFLWLDPEDVDGLGTPAIPPAQVVNKTGRYVLLQPGATAAELIRLPLPLEPTLELGFPRGIRTLVKAAWYSHGGISLQETIIPHVVSRASATEGARVRASFTVPLVELVGATIPVRVSPVATGAVDEQLSLQAPPPLRVRLEVLAETADHQVSAAAPVHLQVRADSPEQATALYLSEGVRLEAGTSLLVRASDDETGERLFEHSLRLVTDWE